MKKTKILSLVLISSALSACHTSRPTYEAQYEQYTPPKTDSTNVPEHWLRAYETDSCYQNDDSCYYYYPNNPVFEYKVPLSFYGGPYLHYAPVQRKGFGYYGYRHSVAA